MLCERDRLFSELTSLLWNIDNDEEWISANSNLYNFSVTRSFPIRVENSKEGKPINDKELEDKIIEKSIEYNKHINYSKISVFNEDF